MMFLPRKKKCRILLTWIILVAFAQVILYAMLFSEFESVPRKLLSKTQQNFHSSKKFFPVEAEARNLGEKLKSDSKHESLLRYRDLTSKTGTRQKILSRKLEKLKVDKEPFLTLSMNNAPNIKSLKDMSQNDRKILVSKSPQTSDVANKVSKVFTQKLRKLPTEPDDIFISVKTTKKYHNDRIKEIINTWWTAAKQQIYFFTDGEDPVLNKSIGGHLVNTRCSVGHQRAALCCKMASELNFFWKNMRRRWFCHFDDDNYVHFPALIKLLQQYNHSMPVYLGKTSIHRRMKTWDKKQGNKEVSFWFATGGAGFCLSQELVSLMVPFFSGQTFPDACARIGVPDDCTIGFISEYLLKIPLKEIGLFHSHLEWLGDIPQHVFHDQISFSHGELGGMKNRIQIDGPFDAQEDPSRFKSLHCFLFPQTNWCPNDREKRTRLKGKEIK